MGAELYKPCWHLVGLKHNVLAVQLVAFNIRFS